MYPAGLCLLHSGLPIRLVIIDPFVVPKRRTSNHVEYNQDDQYHDIYYRHFSPALLQACYYACFAWVASITELLLIVAPSQAIRVRPHEPASWGPHRLVVVNVAARCGWFATSWLHKIVPKSGIYVSVWFILICFAHQISIMELLQIKKVRHWSKQSSRTTIQSLSSSKSYSLNQYRTSSCVAS